MSVTCVFFFFKQKTAYEMRISDWSSDVCSSDLEEVAVAGPRMAPGRGARPTLQHELAAHELAIIFADRAFYRSEAGIGQIGGAGPFPDIAEHRSEEHTSELQSLMRISYAVFCLKKKINLC